MVTVFTDCLHRNNNNLPVYKTRNQQQLTEKPRLGMYGQFYRPCSSLAAERELVFMASAGFVNIYNARGGICDCVCFIDGRPPLVSENRKMFT